MIIMIIFNFREFEKLTSEELSDVVTKEVSLIF